MYHLFLASKAARQCVLYSEKHPEVDQEDLLQKCFIAYQANHGWGADTWIDQILLDKDPHLSGAFPWFREASQYIWGNIDRETRQDV
jgi:hypothetical protein